MRENCTSGTARGVPGNRHSYRRGAATPSECEKAERIYSISVAERSFSLLHRVQMFVKPMAQLFLCNCR